MAFSISIRLAGSDEPDAVLASVASLRAQIYPHWQLIVPAAIDATLRAQLAFLAGPEHLALAAPEQAWILPILAGDELAADALAEFALAALAQPGCDLIYADQVEAFGTAAAQHLFCKPAWSPEFLLATDYIGRAVLAPRHAARLGQYGANFDEIDLWSLWLDFGAAASDIVHVARPLLRVRRRAPDAMAALVPRAMSMLAAAGLRRNFTGRPVRPDWARDLGVLVFDHVFPDTGPSVAILIPTRNNAATLRRCLHTLGSTSYRNAEIVILDNESDDPTAREVIARSGARVLRIASPATGFSFSAINNQAAAAVAADYLVFLNDDTEIITPDWLSHLVGWQGLAGVGSVGARLRFPDGRLQHAGIGTGLLHSTLPAPQFKGLQRDALGWRAMDRTARNCAAVTAACMLTPRDLFRSLGGFEETDFAIAYNDCDYGLRLADAGYRTVIAPGAELYHIEGASRGSGAGNDRVSEEVAFITRYRHWRNPWQSPSWSRHETVLQPGARSAMGSAVPRQLPPVALFSHNLNVEGAPLVLADIARGLRDAGARVTFISPQDGPLRAVLQDEAIEVLVLDSGVYGAREPEALELALAPVIAALQARAIGVVLANTQLTHWGLAAAHRAGLPSLWVIHESEPPFAHLESWGTEHLRLAQLAFLQTYVNIFVCHATRALYLGLDAPAKLEVIYNAADTERFLPQLRACSRATERARLSLGPDDVLFLLPGVVTARKAQVDLLRALESLSHDQGRNCRFISVGDRPGPYSDLLHRHAARLGAYWRRRLQIVPECSDIWRYYAASDVVVVTSHLESFPRVVQEGMMAGRAMISTPVFGIAEQLRHGQTALLFPPGDVGALAAHIARLAQDPALRARLGEAAQCALAQFPNLQEMRESYVALVREAMLCGAPRPGPPQSGVMHAAAADAAPGWWPP